MNCQDIIDFLYQQVRSEANEGEVADYIPELKKADPNDFGIHLTSTDLESYQAGDYDKPFSIQSIAKVLSLGMAIEKMGAQLWKRVDVEPSGNSFNSLLQLEKEFGIPRNPLINSGAIVVCDVLVSHCKDVKQEFLTYLRSFAGQEIDFDATIALSEKLEGYRNYALANYLKSFGNLQNDVEEVLDFYFNLCSIKLSCKALSRLFLHLANQGFHPVSQKQVLSKSNTKRINAIMGTCGFYDEAGEFAYRVGLPGKSGVGGGIIAVHPGQYAIAVYSPKLNPKGNSARGMKFLERFTSKTESSIF